MSTFLYYDNKQIFSGQPTPLVAREDSMIRYGERWAAETTITLYGQITGCPNDYLGMIDKQQKLIDVFSRDFQEFRIVLGQTGATNFLELQDGGFLLLQDGTRLVQNGGVFTVITEDHIEFENQDFIQFENGTFLLTESSAIVTGEGIIYRKPYCLIKNGITFQPSNYVGIVNYSVSLSCYEQDIFSGFYGVIEPRDSWTYEEQEDQRLLITHSIGAKGFNTNYSHSDALDNAKAFVQSRTGFDQEIYPTFITFPSGAQPCLRQVKENVNRMVGSYSVDLKYEMDLYYATPGILRYSTSYDCNKIEGLAKVSVEGKYEGCLNQDMASIRSVYNNFDIYNAAYQTYFEATNQTDLNSGYLSSGVIEDPYKKTLSFNVDFDNYSGANVFFDYRVSLNSGENDITTVDFEGTVSARGDARTRWDRVTGFYATGFDPFSLANAEYQNFAGLSIPLNPQPLSSGVTFNQFVSQISTRASWNNKEIPISGFQDLEYSTSYTPALERVAAKPLATDSNGPICGDYYYIVDLGYKNRVVFGINGNGKVQCGYNMHTAISNLKAYANQLFHSGCPQSRVVLEQNQITTGINTINFSFSWSAESSNNVVIPKVEYNQINNLAL